MTVEQIDDLPLLMSQIEMCNIKELKIHYLVGKHKDLLAENHQKIHISLKLERNEVQIDLRRRKKGWQIYACNAPISILSIRQ